MYIRKTTRIYKGKQYTNYLLVESVQTPKGPRQRTICSLGNLAPAPAEEWLALAHKLESSLQGQLSLPEAPAADVAAVTERARRGRRRREARDLSAVITVDSDHIEVQEPREAGT